MPRTIGLQDTKPYLMSSLERRTQEKTSFVPSKTFVDQSGVFACTIVLNTHTHTNIFCKIHTDAYWKGS